MLGLGCCEGFSLVVESRCYSLSSCMGFSVQWLILWQSTGSRHTGISRCSTWAQELQLLGSRAQAQKLWGRGLAALQHVGSSPIRDRTCSPALAESSLLSHQGSPLIIFHRKISCVKYCAVSLSLVHSGRYTDFALPPAVHKSSSSSIHYYKVLSTDSDIWMICVSVVYFFFCYQLYIHASSQD